MSKWLEALLSATKTFAALPLNRGRCWWKLNSKASSMLPSYHSNLQDLGPRSSGLPGSRWYYKDHPYYKDPSYNLGNRSRDKSEYWLFLR